jgi:mRNA-degrading endonuclease RelE of RelBE toxin-antitoxin system
MKTYFTKTFVRDYRKLTREMQEAVDKQLELLLSNARHPSLNVKKMNDPRDIWEGRVTASYRFTFHMESDTYVLRRVGTQDINLSSQNAGL